MKDDVNDEVPNGTLKSLILFDGVLKLDNKQEGHHVTHFFNWIEKIITWGLVQKH
jgi:hypothetical protein